MKKANKGTFKPGDPRARESGKKGGRARGRGTSVTITHMRRFGDQVFMLGDRVVTSKKALDRGLDWTGEIIGFGDDHEFLKIRLEDGRIVSNHYSLWIPPLA